MCTLVGVLGRQDPCGAVTAPAVQIPNSGGVWSPEARPLMEAPECIPRCGWTRFNRFCHPHCRRQVYRISTVAAAESPAAVAAAALPPAPGPQPQPRPVLPLQRHPQQVCKSGDSAEVRGTEDQLSVMRGILARTSILGTRNAFEAVVPRRQVDERIMM